MPFNDIWIAFKVGLLPVAFAIGLATIPVYLLARFVSKVDVSGQFVFLVAFGSLGGLLGYSAGASQQSIIGTVLPTLLTLITLLLGYIFSKDTLPHLKPVIPFCLVALILNAFFCLFLGGRVKRENADFEREYNRRLLYYEKVELEVEKARQLKEIQAGEAR
jgi:hypothetical protein